MMEDMRWLLAIRVHANFLGAMTKKFWVYLAAILVALSAAVPVRAEADLKLPRESVTLVSPPFVHAHEVAKSGPKIIEFKMTVVEKPIVIDEVGTTIPGLTYNGSIPGPLMVVHEGDYVELTLVNPATNTMTHTIDFHAQRELSGEPHSCWLIQENRPCCAGRRREPVCSSIIARQADR